MFCDNLIILSIILIKIQSKENSSSWVTETVAGDEEKTSYVQVRQFVSILNIKSEVLLLARLEYFYWSPHYSDGK